MTWQLVTLVLGLTVCFTALAITTAILAERKEWRKLAEAESKLDLTRQIRGMN